MKENKEIDYKNYHYEILTKFSQMESLINFYICTYFFTEREEKINFTNIVTYNISTKNLIKIFEKILKINEKEKPYTNGELDKISNMRNNFAHSYFVPSNNYNESENITITKINSNGNLENGYSCDIDLREIKECIEILDRVILKLNEINNYHRE
jgi:hypothetical protein